MILYNIHYSSKTGKISVDELYVRSTRRSYMYPGRRIPHEELDVIYVYSSATAVTAYAYASSLNIMDKFKEQVQVALERSYHLAEEQYNSIKERLSGFTTEFGMKNTEGIPYKNQIMWYNPEIWDYEEDDCE